MERFEYMRIPVCDVPDSIMKQYNLLPLVQNDHVMVEIRKGMYGSHKQGSLQTHVWWLIWPPKVTIKLRTLQASSLTPRALSHFV